MVAYFWTRLVLPLLLFIVSGESMDEVYQECGSVYNCLGIGMTRSESSCVQNKNCKHFVGIAVDLANEQLKTLFYSTGTQRYVAIGISDDSSMGNDDVIASFVVSNSNGSVFVHGRTDGRRGVEGVEKLPGQGSSFQLVNGGFSSKLVIPLSSLPSEFKFKDFKNNVQYFLLIASGPFSGTDPNYDLKTHGDEFAISGSTLNFAQVQHSVTAGERGYFTRKVHGFCMIWTWMFLMPLGILLARYYKETWADVRLCRRRLWFIFHVTTMLLALAFGLAGYFAILIKNKGIFRNGLNMSGLPIHQAIGFVAIIFLIEQSVGNWFRIRHRFLKVFVAGTHALLGITSYVLGFYNIVTVEILLGNDVLGEERNLQYFPLASMVLVLLFFLFISSYYSWTDWHMDIKPSRAFCFFPLTISTNEEAPRPMFRKGILLAFMICAFTISLIYTILLLT